MHEIAGICKSESYDEDDDWLIFLLISNRSISLNKAQDWHLKNNVDVNIFYNWIKILD